METPESTESHPEPTPSRLESFCQRTEDYVREEPAKAIGLAMGLGFFISVFPVFRLASGLLRLFFGLLRPVLLCLGGIKLYEELMKRSDQDAD
jgi:hypothetical protein